jgi:DNA mismatch repair protein MutS2
MARELGLNPEILKDAEGYLDQEELRAYHLLAEVEAAQDRLTRQEVILAGREKDLAAAAAEVEDQRRKLEETRRRLTEEARAQAQVAIKKAEGEFKAVLTRLKEGQESWGRLRQEFSQLQADLLRELTPAPVPGEREAPEFTVGQKVFLPALGLTGEVLTPPGKDGRLEVRARQVKLKVAPEEITPVDKEADRAKAVCVSYAAPEHLPSLNLIGLRVEEALPLVDRLLDQAVLNGMNRVDIIHGLGTGRLKKAVREYLQHHAQVAEASEGDNPGVTVVDLKE